MKFLQVATVKKLSWKLTALICLVAVPVAQGATESQSHASIAAAAKAFILKELQGSNDVKVDIRDLDRRLKLAKCSQELSAFWPPGARKAGNATVGVRCEGSKPWKIFIQASIAVMENVAVLNRPAARGDVLNMEMIRMESRDTAGNDRYVRDVKALLGYRFRNSAGQGKPLTVRMLAAPRMVRRGESVTILSEAGGIQVRMNGEALADGIMGKVVRVRNASSKRIIEGEVIAKGTIKVRQ